MREQMEEHTAQERRLVLDCAMQAGSILLKNGAEIFRVEETVARMCSHYGVESEKAFVLSNGIFLTAGNGNEPFYAKVQHIPVSGARLDRVAAVNQLSREIEEGRYSPQEDSPLCLLRHLIGLSKPDAPVEKQSQFDLHGMNTGLGYNKATLGHGLKLIWRHEGALYHLEGLAGVILAARDTSAHHCAAAKCFGQLHSCLAGRSETAVKVDLAVIHNHFSAFRTVVFLRKRRFVHTGRCHRRWC